MSPRTSRPSDAHRPRRAPRALAAVVAVASLLMAAGCAASSSAATGHASNDGELVPLTVGAPWEGTSGKAPVATNAFGYAVAQGLADDILAKYGFSYEGFVGFNNGPPVVQALQTGDVQVGFIGDTPATQARASGIDVRAISIARPTSDIWFLGKEGGVSSLDELAGKKVGLQFGSNFDKYGRAALDRAGVGDKVEYINLLFSDALPALQRGEIDAVPLPATVAGLWLAKNDFPILSKAGEDDPDLLATSVTLTSDEFAAKNPKITEAVWAVLQAGAKAIEADHDKYAAWVEEANGQSADIVLAANLWRWADERVDPEGLATVQSTLQFLLDSGTATESFDVNAWVLP